MLLKIIIYALDSVQIKVLIPSAAVGALIGKGGETMRSLKNDTGCRVQMSKNQEVFHGNVAIYNIAYAFTGLILTNMESGRS